MTADFVAYAEQNHEIQEQRRKVLVQSVQDRLDAACACWKGQHGGCQVVEQRVCMPVVGLSYSGTLQIADVTCSTCSTSFQPSALQVGCFPSSPVDPHRWYDLDVFNAFQVLALQDGLSASGFVDFLNEHSQPAAAVDDRQFVLSFFAWLRMSFEVDSWSALGVEGMDSGPFAECPICCTLPGEGGRLGTPTVTAARDLLPATGEAAQPPQQAGDPVPPPPPPVLAVGAPAAGEPAAELADEVALHVHAQPAAPPQPVYRVAVAMDAVVKLGHYENCGRACKGQQPCLRRYFGAADACVRAAHGEGRLTLADTMAGDGGLSGGDAGAAAVGDAAGCSSSLRCSRPEARSINSPCDIHGVCGAVCMHCFPLRGGFVDMPDPENYSYYIYLLLQLLQERSDLTDVYIDFGCRFKVTWERYLSLHPELPQHARDLRIMVNWLHAAGHDHACQLRNSGRYTPGAGRRVGEEAEQVWSMTKVPGKLVRYMTHANRRDFLEALLASVSRRKRRRVAGSLAKKWADNRHQLVTGKAQALKLQGAAGAAGVADVRAAALAYETLVLGSGVQQRADGTAWEVSYVKLLLQLRQLSSLQSAAAGITVVSSSSAANLAAASSSKEISRVNGQLAKLERAHGVTEAARTEWVAGQAPYDRALAALKDIEIAGYRGRIAAEVLDVQRLHNDRQEAGCADKDTRTIMNRARRKRAKVREMLQEMYTWQSLETSNPPSSFELSEEQVKGLWDPELPLPWGGGAGSAASLHYGRLYHKVATDLARSMEERPFVRQERARLELRLQYALQQMRLALARHVQAERTGLAFLVRQRIAEFAALQAEVAAWPAW